MQGQDCSKEGKECLSGKSFPWWAGGEEVAPLWWEEELSEGGTWSGRVAESGR